MNIILMILYDTLDGIQCMIHSQYITLCREIGTLINYFSICILYICIYICMYVGRWVGGYVGRCVCS